MQQTSTPSAVLVTGATGFVGGELLRRLLMQTARPRPIICPVRATSADNAAERGRARLIELLGPDEAKIASARVEWVRGDLESKHLGWDSVTWRRIATMTTEIYHCAASVSFELPLDEAHRINVDGTVHIHELAETAQVIHGAFKRFHHVSTAYVSGTVSGRVNAHHLPSDRAGNFRNTYERTKARAERYLRQRSNGADLTTVPVSIYRPSIVGGDTVTGETDNWNVLYVPMKMAARGLLPVFPIGGRALVDSIGVDYVVDSMLALGDCATEDLEAFHLTAGPEAFTVKDLFRVTCSRAKAHGGFSPSTTRLLTTPQWAALTQSVRLGAMVPKWIGSVRRTASQAQRGLGGCAVYVPYTRVSTEFDTTRERSLLRPYGVSMPDPTMYLETIVDYALDCDFGKRKTSRPVATEPATMDVAA